MGRFLPRIHVRTCNMNGALSGQGGGRKAHLTGRVEGRVAGFDVETRSVLFFYIHYRKPDGETGGFHQFSHLYKDDFITQARH